MGAINLLGNADAVSRARKYVQRVCAGISRNRLHEVVLLTTELATNSVRHSDSGRVPNGRLRIIVTGGVHAIRVQVIDEGSADSAPEVHPFSFSEPYRSRRLGLWIVQEIASSWGWHQHPKGRVVWFEVDL
ncbi:ATP-binding protein [Acrocarpospora pleiomorpha]